jgi:hypothetical protein
VTAEVTESFREEPTDTDHTVVKSEGRRRADASQEDLTYVKNFINDLLSKFLHLIHHLVNVMIYIYSGSWSGVEEPPVPMGKHGKGPRSARCSSAQLGTTCSPSGRCTES